jgi:hypothetical protein
MAQNGLEEALRWQTRKPLWNKDLVGQFATLSRTHGRHRRVANQIVYGLKPHGRI